MIIMLRLLKIQTIAVAGNANEKEEKESSKTLFYMQRKEHGDFTRSEKNTEITTGSW